MAFGVAPVSHHSARHPRQQSAQRFVVVASHHRAVEGHAVHELDEGALDVLHVAIAVHVLAIDVGHHRQNGRELEERAVALVGFGNQVLRGAKPGVGAHGIHAPAHHDRGIEPSGGKHRGHHAGGGRLAVHAGDGNAVFQAHEFRQHLGALDDRKLEAMRLGNLGIISGDGRTGHDGLGALDVLRPMALEDLRSQRYQPRRNRRMSQVGAADAVAKGEQHLGNAAHADAADAYEMNALNLGKHKDSIVKECPSGCRSD